MLTLRMEPPTAVAEMDGAGYFGPLDERELVETSGGLWVKIALIILGSGAIGVLIGATAYVFTH